MLGISNPGINLLAQVILSKYFSMVANAGTNSSVMSKGWPAQQGQKLRKGLSSCVALSRPTHGSCQHHGFVRSDNYPPGYTVAYSWQNPVWLLQDWQALVGLIKVTGCLPTRCSGRATLSGSHSKRRVKVRQKAALMHYIVGPQSWKPGTCIALHLYAKRK